MEGRNKMKFASTTITGAVSAVALLAVATLGAGRDIVAAGTSAGRRRQERRLGHPDQSAVQRPDQQAHGSGVHQALRPGARLRVQQPAQGHRRDRLAGAPGDQGRQVHRRRHHGERARVLRRGREARRLREARQRKLEGQHRADHQRGAVFQLSLCGHSRLPTRSSRCGIRRAPAWRTSPSRPTPTPSRCRSRARRSRPTSPRASPTPTP